jgi:hypothetical protein
MIYGKNSKKKSMCLLNLIELKAFIKTPRDICATPSITDIFILSEFIYASSFLAKNHEGSTPTGYTQSSYRLEL